MSTTLPADLSQAALIARVLELTAELDAVKAKGTKDARYHDWQMQGLSRIIADRDATRDELAQAKRTIRAMRRETALHSKMWQAVLPEVM